MTTLVYAACFLALATLSGLAAASGRRWALRLPLIAATPVLALAVWWQLSHRDGWPTNFRPADGSAFVAGVVEPPTPGHAGAIYLWAQPPNAETPWSYRMAYSRQLERQVARAARTAKRGARVGLRTARTPTRMTRTRSRNGTTNHVSSSRLQFYRLPPPPVEMKAAAS
jgi:hypothetical protein